MMEAVSTSDMSLNLYPTTRCNIREEGHLLHTRRRENPKSHVSCCCVETDNVIFYSYGKCIS
jgi:hypothetical protein